MKRTVLVAAAAAGACLLPVVAGAKALPTTFALWVDAPAATSVYISTSGLDGDPFTTCVTRSRSFGTFDAGVQIRGGVSVAILTFSSPDCTYGLLESYETVSPPYSEDPVWTVDVTSLTPKGQVPAP